MKSKKPIKNIDDIIGNKRFFFPDEISNERNPVTLERCILIRVNGESHYIVTGKYVEITNQEFAILKDANIIGKNISYATSSDFDPINKPYQIYNI